MKRSIIHSIVIFLTASLLPLMAACDIPEDSPVEPSSDVVLHLDIQTVGLTRNATMQDNEKMHSLRVLILHQDGRVEHNKVFSMEEAQVQHSVLLKVSPNEKKKIFLVANEESVSSIEGVDGGNVSLPNFLDRFGEGSDGFEAEVDKLYFTPDFKNKLPMSSAYEIDIPAKGVIEKTFYVVRVATKFTMNFINWRGEQVTVNKFTVESYADKNFLMAQVADSDRNRRLFNGKTWIEWLKEVSDASSENDDYLTTEAAGWLKDYELPGSADKNGVFTSASPITVAEAKFDINDLENIIPGRNTDVFYLPESMNPKAGATDGEQEYTLTVWIDGHPEPFVRKLPNLKALFRNTNVVVNITMFKNLEMTVDVIPFTSQEAMPEYGLEREDFTGFIVGKDENGNKCWYEGNYYDSKDAVPLYLGPKDNHGSFVTVNDKEYLLVYTDYERTAARLQYIYEKENRRKHILTPEGITGYTYGNDMYLNKLQQRVWLDPGGDPDGDDNERAIYVALEKVGLNLKCCRIIYEWDRLDWNRARWWGWKGIYPKFWFDILGNRYSWSEGDTSEKRKDKLGEWVKYLE